MLYIFCVFIGPYMTVTAVWTIADIFNNLMALPNMIALVALSGVAVKETCDCFARPTAAGAGAGDGDGAPAGRQLGHSSDASRGLGP